MDPASAMQTAQIQSVGATARMSPVPAGEPRPVVVPRPLPVARKTRGANIDLVAPTKDDPMTAFYLAMFALPLAIIATAVVLARVTRHRRR